MSIFDSIYVKYILSNINFKKGWGLCQIRERAKVAERSQRQQIKQREKKRKNKKFIKLNIKINAGIRLYNLIPAFRHVEK